MRFTKDDPDRHVLILVVLGRDFYKNFLYIQNKQWKKLVENPK